MICECNYKGSTSTQLLKDPEGNGPARVWTLDLPHGSSINAQTTQPTGQQFHKHVKNVSGHAGDKVWPDMQPVWLDRKGREITSNMFHCEKIISEVSLE